ncbi:MAG: ABC transporter ATP-binding protein [Bacillota bacterium]
MYLALENIAYSYGKKPVLTDVSLDVAKGEFVTLLGPSGCGKTTLLKIIGGFIEQQQGVVRLEGLDITSLAPERRPVATVFQNYALFPHMTVQENVGYGLKFRKDYSKTSARAQIAAALALVGMSDFRDRNVVKLSGGQQQRVALARALILQPKVLLLDEPFSNLDAKLRVAIRAELKAIQQQLGLTMVFVTHDQEEALSLSDRVAVMNGGRILQTAAAKMIYQQPTDGFVADFVGRVNRITTEGQTRLVRPEDVFPVATGGLQGVVSAKQYMGAYSIYFVQTVNGGMVQMDVRNCDDNDWAVGEQLNLAIRE